MSASLPLAERLAPETLDAERQCCAALDAAERAVDTPADALLHLQGAAVTLGARRIGPFDLRAQRGERIAVLGPSGAGKSTLCKLVAGELAPQAGRVRLAGRDAAAAPRTWLAAHRAVLPQSHAVAFAMPVSLVVSLGRFAHGEDAATPTIVEQALGAACAQHLAQRRFDTLSGGEQARVQLARVLAQLWDVRDGLLLVDEPLAALDPGLQFELLDVLVDFAAERRLALVAVLHDINLALRGFDRLWLLREGAVVADIGADRQAVPALEVLFGIALRWVIGDDGQLAVVASRLPRAQRAA